jgi:hypothetical protein
MVGHHYIDGQPAVISVGGIPQTIEITVIVAIAIESRAVIAALRRAGCLSAAKPWMAESGNDVLGNTGKIETRLAGHEPPPCGLVLTAVRYESLSVIRGYISDNCGLTLRYPHIFP